MVAPMTMPDICPPREVDGMYAIAWSYERFENKTYTKRREGEIGEWTYFTQYGVS